MAKDKELIEVKEPEQEYRRIATGSIFGGGMPTFGADYGTFLMPNGAEINTSPEKLIIPKDYHSVVRMSYDFFQRGGIVSTVVGRITEFSITEIRNGQRKTTDEANAYYEALLHDKPSRLMRFLRIAALEYLLSGLVVPRIDWVPRRGSEVSPDLKADKTYYFPVFDLYPPLLVDIHWAGWGKKTYLLKIPSKDVRLIRSGGSRIKEQQAKFLAWQENYPSFVSMIQQGADHIEITDADPMMRKEISISPYPTPYLFPVLEPLVYKQQLRRMDFSVASRVINAILLVQEGDKDFPLVGENEKILMILEQQIEARAGDPRLQERLFTLFTNHTTKLTWIHPDVQAMLSQEKYSQVNDDLQEGLGFTKILLTGESRQAQASEISTYAIQPMMEELRSMMIEWIDRDVYWKAAQLNKFGKKYPSPSFRPIRLQDFVKTAAIFAQAFKEGGLSRTTRAESIGTDFQTETELMRDEAELMKGLPAYQPTPYSPPPPIVGQTGRPQGSSNVPVNNRNSGVKPPNQTPTSRVAAALMDDSEFITLLDKVATDLGVTVTPEDIINEN